MSQLAKLYYQIHCALNQQPYRGPTTKIEAWSKRTITCEKVAEK